MNNYKQLAPQLAKNSAKVLTSIKSRNIVARLKYFICIQKNEIKFKGIVEKFLIRHFSLELNALITTKNDVAKASLKVKKAKAIAKAEAKKAAAKKVATKKTATKKVASKKVVSKKVAAKKVIKKVAKKAAPAKKVAVKKSK